MLMLPMTANAAERGGTLPQSLHKSLIECLADWSIVFYLELLLLALFNPFDAFVVGFVKLLNTLEMD